MDPKEIGLGGGVCVDWIDLAHDRHKGGARVNTVIKRRVPQVREISWLVEELSASQEGLCSMEIFSSLDYAYPLANKSAKLGLKRLCTIGCTISVFVYKNYPVTGPVWPRRWVEV